jgi:phospholipid/cholesterol/gamma-HCH transport system substrate-binding protein
MSRTVRLGMFILGALSILAVGIFLIGREQGLFMSGYTLKAAFTNVSGLQNGAPVRVGGIIEGSVRTIKLPTNPNQKVIVVMQLAKATRQVIKKDSVGAIHSEGLVGAEYVEISFGSEDAPPVKDGDTIGSEPPIDFSDLLKKTNAILDSTGSLTTNMNLVAENLGSITTKIKGGQGSLGALVNDKSMYKELYATTTQAQAGAAAFKDNMQALQHNFLLRGYFNKRGYSDSEDLTAHEIDSLPQGSYTKKFSYDAKQIFDKGETAKLKSAKAMDEAGRFLEANKFSMAVVVAYTGATGDSERDKTLTEARSMVVRDYLVKNFKIMDDTLVKTMGLGKNTPEGMESDGGIEILIFPSGSNIPYATNPDVSNHQ